MHRSILQGSGRLAKRISKCRQLHCHDQSISSAAEMQSHLEWQAGESKGPPGLCQVSPKCYENDKTIWIIQEQNYIKKWVSIHSYLNWGDETNVGNDLIQVRVDWEVGLIFPPFKYNLWRAEKYKLRPFPNSVLSCLLTHNIPAKSVRSRE